MLLLEKLPPSFILFAGANEFVKEEIGPKILFFKILGLRKNGDFWKFLATLWKPRVIDILRKIEHPHKTTDAWGFVNSFVVTWSNYTPPLFYPTSQNRWYTELWKKIK